MKYSMAVIGDADGVVVEGDDVGNLVVGLTVGESGGLVAMTSKLVNHGGVDCALAVLVDVGGVVEMGGIAGVGAIVGLEVVGGSDGLLVMRCVVGAIVLEVIGGSDGLLGMRCAVGLFVSMTVAAEDVVRYSDAGSTGRDSKELGAVRDVVGLTVDIDGDTVVVMLAKLMPGALVMTLVFVITGSAATLFDPSHSFWLPTTTTTTAMMAAVATKTNPPIMTLYF